MKKFFAVIALTAILGGISLEMQAKKRLGSPVIEIMKKYGGAEGVEAVNLGGFMLGLAKMASIGKEGAEFLSCLDKMAVFTAEDSPEHLKEVIVSDVRKALSGYEKMMEMKDDGADFTIYVLMKAPETVSEMVMVSESDVVMIYMEGEIPVSEIDRMAESAVD